MGLALEAFDRDDGLRMVLKCGEDMFHEATVRALAADLRPVRNGAPGGQSRRRRLPISVLVTPGHFFMQRLDSHSI